MRDVLADKVALVTGGAAGIGRAIALMFAQQGASLVVLDKDEAGLQQLQAEFDDGGWPLLTVTGDACNTNDVRQVMAAADTAHGQLDILVNNVGDFLGIIKPLAEMTDEDIDALINVNLRQTMICSREAIPLLRRSEAGSIIVISSIEGFRAMPNITPYGACKLGLSGFVKSLALELSGEGIRVNAIAPETTETDHVTPQAWMSAEDYSRQSQWIPLGRFGKPEDTAGCALFLASSLSAWVTGTTIHCDGGALAAAGWYRAPNGAWSNTPVFDRSAIGGLMPEDQAAKNS